MPNGLAGNYWELAITRSETTGIVLYSISCFVPVPLRTARCGAILYCSLSIICLCIHYALATHTNIHRAPPVSHVGWYQGRYCEVAPRSLGCKILHWCQANTSSIGKYIYCYALGLTSDHTFRFLVDNGLG